MFVRLYTALGFFFQDGGCERVGRPITEKKTEKSRVKKVYGTKIEHCRLVAWRCVYICRYSVFYIQIYTVVVVLNKIHMNLSLKTEIFSVTRSYLAHKSSSKQEGV